MKAALDPRLGGLDEEYAAAYVIAADRSRPQRCRDEAAIVAATIARSVYVLTGVELREVVR
ncbi:MULTISPECIES: hypothetical protein [Protofrankia]|uniref:Uncharacterized protein n=1 Tax=Protofrankia coriariae TaxID=1562887 RepID=A0ABR5F2E4_9ACTN|nr:MULTISPECIES: hypothetical protein [Protofrankia]KLL10818.1 hypothetical protein FrCorBMG51_15485 [Protofrankia coriariae]ONH34020.1 hypothetical protein BL254_18450 [Protofrankia sp. BMG5.30]